MAEIIHLHQLLIRWRAGGREVERSCLRGMPRKDAWSHASLVETGKIRIVSCNGVEVQRTGLTCAMQSFIETAEARVSQLMQGDSPSGVFIAESCLLQAKLAVCSAIMSYGYMRLASAIELFHCTHVKLMSDWGLDESMRLDKSSRLHLQLLVTLPILKIPFRFTGVVGSTAFVVIPNVPGLPDQDLHVHVGPVLQLLRSINNAAAAGPALKACDVQLLKQAMPSTVSPLVDWLICKAGFGVDVNSSLGITYARAQHVGKRFALLCDVELPRLKLEAQGMVLSKLAAKAGVGVETVKIASAKATTRKLRHLVNERGILRDSRWAYETALAIRHPELLEIVQEIVRTNAIDDIVYKRVRPPLIQCW